jgi:DNA-binding transcriptional LysR family regulator
VAKTLRQHRYRAGSGGVFVVADNDPQVAVKHDQGLLLMVVDMDGTGVAAPGEVVGQGEGPAGLLAAEAHLGQQGFLRATAAPPGIRLQTLLTERLLAGVPADHRLAHRDEIALSELADEPFVFFPRHRSVLAYDEFIASCRAAGFSPTIVQEASGLSALGLVAAGLGVTVVAASYRSVSLTGVHFVPITGHHLTLQLAWSADNTNPALPTFLETVRQLTADGELHLRSHTGT